MPTRQEAEADGRPFRVSIDARTGKETAEFLTAEEISKDAANAQAETDREASRAPNRDEAIDALLQKEAVDPSGSPVVKSYIASL